MTQDKLQPGANQPPVHTEPLRRKFQTENPSQEIPQEQATDPIWESQPEQRAKPGRRPLFRS
jgi:hypothetical protein